MEYVVFTVGLFIAFYFGYKTGVNVELKAMLLVLDRMSLKLDKETNKKVIEALKEIQIENKSA